MNKDSLENAKGVEVNNDDNSISDADETITCNDDDNSTICDDDDSVDDNTRDQSLDDKS